MRREVIHEQVVSVVHKEVQCVYHLSIIAYQRHLDSLLNHLSYGLLGLLLLLQELNLHLLFALLEKEFGLSDNLFTLLECLLDLGCLLEDIHIVAVCKLLLLLLKELGTVVCLLV